MFVSPQVAQRVVGQNMGDIELVFNYNHTVMIYYCLWGAGKEKNPN